MTTPDHTHCKNDESGHSGTRLGDFPTSAYSPDVSPSDCYLIHFLFNNLRGVSFNNKAELQNFLDNFFTSKPADFFKLGI
jgi:hypothetical protein